MPTDIEIAQRATLQRIGTIAAKAGIPDDAVEPYGHYKAKISLDWLAQQPARPGAKLVLVTAISPTPAGEGKTTATVGLGDALNRLGRKTMICLREPSMGPVFGIKGGAAGGGHAQVVPMEDINLHFTGDFAAIAQAHNLLAAAIDNHIHHGNALGIDPTRIRWKRVMDMNDRDLRMRLGNIVFGVDRQGMPLRARQLNVHGAMTVLLRDAIKPNLVQTLENNPALVHGGPFANIAHGCSSVIATQAGLKLADYVVTEAGFGADLGAEKFLDIKCRKADLWPDACVIVATVRALKYNGGVPVKELATENLDALKKGLVNLERHVDNITGAFGLPAVVAINRFDADTDAELALIRDAMRARGVDVVLAEHWAKGGAGAEALAQEVIRLAEQGGAVPGHGRTPHFLYPDDMPLWDKLRTVATRIYGAADIVAPAKVRKQIDEWQAQGYGSYPICVAKTAVSFSADPTLLGAPSGHTVNVRDVRLSAGAGFIVMICGDIMTMPGLPKAPSAERIDIGPDGRVVGLF